MEIFYILFPCTVLLFMAMFFRQSRRSKEMIRQWAVQSGYQILLIERPLFNRGPFFWTTSRQQTVYRVEVQNNEGQVQKAWIRCGHWLTGVSSDEIEVRWED